MRITGAFIVLLLSSVVNAQSILPGRFLSNTYAGYQLQQLGEKDSSRQSKWSLSRYAAVSANYLIAPGGRMNMVSVPAGLQLQRRLTNHLYAFSTVSVAPAYFSFGSAVLPPGFSNPKAGNGFAQPGNLGIASRAELGLMYTNNEKTFSISGSIGIEKSSVPALYYNPINATHPNTVLYPNR